PCRGRSRPITRRGNQSALAPRASAGRVATMDLGLRGRVAIVTGSSRGIGRAIASSLADEGARLVINARGAAALQTVADELTARGTEVLAVAADVTTADGCQAVFDRTRDRVGQIEVLVTYDGSGAAAASEAPE